MRRCLTRSGCGRSGARPLAAGRRRGARRERQRRRRRPVPVAAGVSANPLTVASADRRQATPSGDSCSSRRPAGRASSGSSTTTFACRSRFHEPYARQPGASAAALLICAASPSMLRAQPVQAQRAGRADAGGAGPGDAAADDDAAEHAARADGDGDATRRSAAGLQRRPGRRRSAGHERDRRRADSGPEGTDRHADFLPYKSYRLLDAGWLMCCGEQSSRRRPESPADELDARPARSRRSGVRAAPDGVADGWCARFVQFDLLGTPAAGSAESPSTPARTSAGLPTWRINHELLREADRGREETRRSRGRPGARDPEDGVGAAQQ